MLLAELLAPTFRKIFKVRAFASAICAVVMRTNLARGANFVAPDFWHFVHRLGDFFAFLGGRPPARVLRRAAILRKYSGPRLAVAWPPLLPSDTAAGSFFMAQ